MGQTVSFFVCGAKVLSVAPTAVSFSVLVCLELAVRFSHCSQIALQLRSLLLMRFLAELVIVPVNLFRMLSVRGRQANNGIKKNKQK